MISPLESFAETGVSTKVLMPFIYDKLLMFDCKTFCPGKFTRLHADRLTQGDLPFNDKDRLPVSSLHVHVDRGVIVAVEEESESVFGKYCRHKRIFFR